MTDNEQQVEEQVQEENPQAVETSQHPEAKKEKKQKYDDLDTETTFADMNIEGFRWYDPSRKKNGGKVDRIKLTRKEYWSMVGGALLAYLPMILCVIGAFGLVIGLMYLWLL